MTPSDAYRLLRRHPEATDSEKLAALKSLVMDAAISEEQRKDPALLALSEKAEVYISCLVMHWADTES